MARKEKGVAHITLTQVLLVFVIIGILVAIAIPITKERRLKAKIDQVEKDFKVIRKAMKAYFERYSHYPVAPAWATQPQDATPGDCTWQRDLINAKLLLRSFSDPFASEEGKAFYYYQHGDKNWIVVSVGPDHELGRDYSQDFGEGTLVIYKEKDDIMVSNMDVIDYKQRYPSTSG